MSNRWTFLPGSGASSTSARRWRPHLVVVATSALLLGAAPPIASATTGSADTAAAGSSLQVHKLRVDGLVDPLGIDDESPSLSWHLKGSDRGQAQSAYQVQAASTRQLLTDGRPDLWDSGRVASPDSAAVEYAGEALGSRDQVYWRVRAWDADGLATDWSPPARWEMGLLDEADWTADWIANKEWLNEPTPVTTTFEPQTARYVRINATRLGLPLTEFPDSPPLYRLQLAEIVVEDSSDPGTDLALDQPVLASERNSTSGTWQPKFATDGDLTTDRTSEKGYTTNSRTSPDVSDAPVWIQVDLDTAQRFDTVKLYGRTDLVSADGRIGHLPGDYTVQVSDSADGPFTVAATVENQEPPFGPHSKLTMPLFAKHVQVDRQIRQARLYMSGLGMYEARVNGEPVTDSVLQPPQTEFEDRVIYSTYDVTSRLRRGGNTLGVMLGGGYYNVPAIGERYTWFRTLGVPKLIAQLEIRYADGTTQRVVSDGSWRTSDGPITFSSLHGGEDHDARARQPGWDGPAADHAGWAEAVPVGPPSDHVALSAQMQPGIEIVDEFETVAITEPRPGVYVFDLGENIAGWPVLNVEGEAGTVVTMRPSERLGADGMINTGGMGVDNSEYVSLEYNYTLAGTGRTESWHPQFSYHGFRYLEVTGLPSEPTEETVSAMVLRAANERAGSFDSSDALLNGIHDIIDRAVQGNMYSFLTDCPDREKMPWLEEMHLLFGVVARNYDVAAYYRNTMRNIADAQYDNGMVPSKAPAYSLSSGAFVDEPNWGSAIIMIPWEMYRHYGDRTTMAQYYEPMVDYFDYLTSKADGHLITEGLGDWVAIDKSTPAGLTSTYGYYRDAVALSRIADVLGKPGDSEHFAQMATAIADAFNAEYFDPETQTYASGSQASNALALDMGVVPDEHEQAVVDNLVDSVRANDDHLTVGEIGLPSLFRVLSAHGHDDVVFDIAAQTTHPSYGYQILHGATSLTELWDGPTAGWSQNHFMLGAIDEWFTAGLAGIRQADDSVAFRDLLIKPAVVGDLVRASGSITTPYGEVASSWQRVGMTYQLDINVPVGARATVHVPLFGHDEHSATEGARLVGIEDDHAIYQVGSGAWHFTSFTGEIVQEDRVQLDVSTEQPNVPVVDGHGGSATFRVFNLMDHAVQVRPSVDVPNGYQTTVDQPQLTIPARSGANVGVDIARTDPAAGQGDLTFRVDDESVTMPLEPTDNLARIATTTASSTHSNFSPSRTNDGDVDARTNADLWDGGGGWNDGTRTTFPDWLRAIWDEPVRVSRVVVHTLDAAKYPASRFGLRDYDVQALVDGQWQTVHQVRGATQGVVESNFDPLDTTAVRLLVTDTNDHAWSRVVELQAF